jgi:hypothetical protein
MLNITPHTDDSGVMKQHSAIEVGDVLKDKGGCSDLRKYWHAL